MGFQVPRGFFGVHVSDEKHQELNEIVRCRVKALLNDEQHNAQHIRRGEHVLHPADWTSMGKLHHLKGLQIYRRRLRDRSLRQLAMEEDFAEARRAVETGHPSMVAIGYVTGSIQDMMYGMSATSQADLKTGFSYKDPPKECALLGNLEGATSEDPFHSADLIWAIPDLPRIVRRVDICYLKATGVGYDRQGKRYGYMVLHSVDLAGCPPFDKPRYNIIRAKIYFACLFREYRPGQLYVLVRGIFNLNGAVKMQYMLNAATASFIGGLFNGVGIGESKKLTIMARRNQAELQNLAQAPMASECSMCLKRGGKIRFFGVHLEECRVCGVAICSQCLVAHKSRKRLFLGPKRACEKYPCCPSCVQDAKRMSGVRPADPEYVVVADYYRIQRAQSQSQIETPSSSSSGSSGEVPPAPLAQHSLDSMTRSLRRDDVLKTNTSEGMWTNSTANESSEGGYRCSDVSDLNSDDYNFASGEADDDDVLLDFESEPSPESQLGSDTSEIVPWEGGGRISVDDDFTTSTNVQYASREAAMSAASTRHQQELWERMLDMQMVANDAYAQTLMNGEAIWGGEALPRQLRPTYHRR